METCGQAVVICCNFASWETDPVGCSSFYHSLGSYDILGYGYGCALGFGCGVFHYPDPQNQSVADIRVQSGHFHHTHSTSCQNLEIHVLGHGRCQIWLTAQLSIHSYHPIHELRLLHPWSHQSQ